jgi:hypothetical protein
MLLFLLASAASALEISPATLAHAQTSAPHFYQFLATLRDDPTLVIKQMRSSGLAQLAPAISVGIRV